MGTAHHMLLFGCKEPGQRETLFRWWLGIIGGVVLGGHKKQSFYGITDKRLTIRVGHHRPPLRSAFLDFFGVRLTLGYDYTCSETDFIKTITIIQLVDQNSQFLLSAALSQSRNFETPHKRWNVFWVSKNQISMPIRRRITHSYSVGIFLISDFHQILAVVKMAGWFNWFLITYYQISLVMKRPGWYNWYSFASYHQWNFSCGEMGRVLEGTKQASPCRSGDTFNVP